jgi:hypothetical protein
VKVRRGLYLRITLLGVQVVCLMACFSVAPVDALVVSEQRKHFPTWIGKVVDEGEARPALTAP